MEMKRRPQPRARRDCWTSARGAAQGMRRACRLPSSLPKFPRETLLSGTSPTGRRPLSVLPSSHFPRGKRRGHRRCRCRPCRVPGSQGPRVRVPARLAPLAQQIRRHIWCPRCFWVMIKIEPPDVARSARRKKLVDVPCESSQVLQIYFPLCLRRASCIFFLAAAAARARSRGLSSVGGGVEGGAIRQSSPPMPAFFAKVSGW